MDLTVFFFFLTSTGLTSSTGCSSSLLEISCELICSMPFAVLLFFIFLPTSVNLFVIYCGWSTLFAFMLSPLNGLGFSESASTSINLLVLRFCGFIFTITFSCSSSSSAPVFFFCQRAFHREFTNGSVLWHFPL